jgi:predicted RNase H-like HicB family nuclease
MPNHLVKIAHYTLILRPEPEGGFTATIPALPGCITYGRDLKEARKMAQDAISGYIASLKKHGEPIPTDEQSLVTSLDFPLPTRYAPALS